MKNEKISGSLSDSRTIITCAAFYMGSIFHMKYLISSLEPCFFHTLSCRVDLVMPNRTRNAVLDMVYQKQVFLTACKLCFLHATFSLHKCNISCQMISMASPNEKNRYRSLTASLYAASTCSLPARADTSIKSVDSGRWKFVIRPSSTRKR